MSEQIKARPITFTAEMIPRILDGSKTQSRRVIRGVPTGAKLVSLEEVLSKMLYFAVLTDVGQVNEAIRSRYGPVAQLLYVQESFRVTKADSNVPIAFKSSMGEALQYVCVHYKDGSRQYGVVPYTHADKPTSKPTGKWHSGRFMPQWASRIMLERTGCRVERVQDITASDAKAEGAPPMDIMPERLSNPEFADDIEYLWGFQALWDSINEKRGHGWDANDWVDVVKFKVIESLQEKSVQSA